MTGGKRIQYTVRELLGSEALENGAEFKPYGADGETYTVTYSSSGNVQAGYAWNVVNTVGQSKVSVSATKEWSGGDPAYRPALTFTLWKDGVATNQTKAMVYDETTGIGSLTFEDLDQYTFNGNTCTKNIYTIVETMEETALAARYTPANTTGEDGVIRFVNTFNAGTKDISITKTWVDGAAAHTGAGRFLPHPAGRHGADRAWTRLLRPR